MAKRTKKNKSNLKLEALETRQLLAGVTGAGTEVGTDIKHPNGNTYDQVLLTGGSVTVTADPGQITRVSFLDASGDIVQAEFSGKGTLNITMADGYTTGNQPTGYNQTLTGGYVKGLASFTISGEDASTNFNVFSVGSGNAAPGNTLFDATHTGGSNHVADVQRLTIVADPANPNGSTFGSIFAGNAVFSGTSGVVGISAANVQVQNLVRVGDIDASGSATPTLTFGANSNFGAVDITGGDLAQTNAKSINNVGSYNFGLNFVAGTDSTGATLAAQQPASGLTFGGANPFAAAAKSLTLTSGIDTVVGGAGDDIISAQLGGTATITPLDSIDGGAGTDTLLVNDVTGGLSLPGGITIKNVENLTLASAGGVGSGLTAFDTSGLTGVTKVNVLASAGNDFIKVGSGQSAVVSDVAGTVTLTGGTTQDVTTAGGYVLSGASGAVKVTDTAQAAIASSVNGGTSVDVTATAANAGGTTGTITVGGSVKPTGAVTIKNTVVNDPTYTSSTTGGAIAVTGGTTVSITETASGTANPTVGGSNKTVTDGNVSVAGTSTTTSITIVQDPVKSAGSNTAAVAAATEQDTVTFTSLTSGQSVSFGGYTVIAPTGGLTSAQVAAAFANLSNTALTSGWTTGPVVGTNQVVFTATSSGAKTLTTGSNTLSNEVITLDTTNLVAGNTVTILGTKYTLLAGGGGGAANTALVDAFDGLTLSPGGGVKWTAVSDHVNKLTFTPVAGATGGVADTEFGISTAKGTGTANPGTGVSTISTHPTTAVTGVVAVTVGVNGAGASAGRTGSAPGTVTITDGGSSAVNTISLTNYGTTNIASTTALTSVSLKNTSTSSGAPGTFGGSTGSATITGTLPALDLTVDSGANGNLGTITANSVTALKVHATGSSTTTSLIATGATSLTVDGTKNLTLNGPTATTPSNLSSVTSVTILGAAGFSYSGLPAGTTDVNASGTSGNVSVTLNPSIATYEGGSGNDNLTITAAPTKAISGGSGDDRLILNVSSATLSNPSGNTNISGFETLELFNGDGTTTPAGLASGAYVATGFTGLRVGATAGAVSFTNVAAGTALTQTAAQTNNVTYTLADPSGTTDALTINTNGGAQSDVNQDKVLTASGIELVTINTSAGSGQGNLDDTAATSITITGNNSLRLGTNSTTALTTVDGSAATGALTIQASGTTTAQTITGGTANDILIASTAGATNDVLNGGAGRDILVSNNAQNKLNGGADNDTFVIQNVPTTLNTYSTIDALNAGEVLIMPNKGLETFGATAITLGDTAAFKDFADAVVTAGGVGGATNGYIGWFQYAGNTYVVESMHDGAGTPGFQNGIDAIVRITGLVDLSKAALQYSTLNLGGTAAATKINNASLPDFTGFPEIVIR